MFLLHLQTRSEKIRCTDQLRRIGKALNLYHMQHDVFPTGTIVVDRLPPEKRLSWMAALLPHMDLMSAASLPNTAPLPRGMALESRLDLSQAWDAAENRPVADTWLSWFVCPASAATPIPGEPGVTYYLGIGGVGKDAAGFSKDDARAGFFGYDRRITRADLTRGLSNVMTVAESGTAGTPWAAGGPATVRCVLPEEQPAIGTGCPFGGLHSEGVNVLFADGRVQFIGARVDPVVWQAQATIQDKEGQR